MPSTLLYVVDINPRRILIATAVTIAIISYYIPIHPIYTTSILDRE